MAISNLTTQYISASFQSLMQVSSSGLIYDGLGAQVTNLVLTSVTASFNGLATSASVAGTVTTAAQPNITSVGTLTGLTVAGTLTANTYILSSSVTSMTVEFASGSTAFGNSSDDAHTFIGSVTVTGSLVVSGSSTFRNIGPAQFTGSVISTQGFTGSLQGTASIATNVAYSGLTGAVPTWNQNTTGNAATATLATTVTTNANLTGVVTSIGNATSIANSAITNAMLFNSSVANLSGTNTGDQTNITGNAATATNVAYTGLTGTVPTWNQNTTGNAATATLATTATSATTATTATTASFISSNFISASVAASGFGSSTPASASYSITSSYALSASYSISSSYSINASNANNTPYSGLTGAVTIWNQNTTGNADTATTASYIDPTFISASAAASGFGGATVSASYALQAMSASVAIKADKINDSQGNFPGGFSFYSGLPGGQPFYILGTSASDFYIYTRTEFIAGFATTASYISPTFISASAAASGFGTGGGAVGTGSVTINNNTDNNLVTATGTANTFNGENSLTFNGSVLALTGALTVTGGITGSLQGTATTASYIDPTFISASAAASGFGGATVSASYAATASYVLQAISASFVTTLAQDVAIAKSGGTLLSMTAGGAGGTEFRLLPNSTGGFARINVGNTTQPLDFQMNSSTKVTITQAGNVGIGTTTPTATLDVNGNVYATSVTASFKGNLVGTASNATNVAYSGLTGTVPTWNQNTSGNAATATTATTATNVAFSGITSLPAGISVTGVAAVENLTNAATASLLTNGTFYSVDASIKPINILLDEGGMPLGTEFTFFAKNLTNPITFAPDIVSTIISENGYRLMYGTGSAVTAKLIGEGPPIWALIGSLKAS